MNPPAELVTRMVMWGRRGSGRRVVRMVWPEDLLEGGEGRVEGRRGEGRAVYGVG